MECENFKKEENKANEIKSEGIYWNDFHYFNKDNERIINLEVCFNMKGFINFWLETNINEDSNDKYILIKLRDFLNTLEL